MTLAIDIHRELLPPSRFLSFQKSTLELGCWNSTGCHLPKPSVTISRQQVIADIEYPRWNYHQNGKEIPWGGKIPSDSHCCRGFDIGPVVLDEDNRIHSLPIQTILLQ